MNVLKLKNDIVKKTKHLNFIFLSKIKHNNIVGNFFFFFFFFFFFNFFFFFFFNFINNKK